MNRRRHPFHRWLAGLALLATVGLLHLQLLMGAPNPRPRPPSPKLAPGMAVRLAPAPSAPTPPTAVAPPPARSARPSRHASNRAPTFAAPSAASAPDPTPAPGLLRHLPAATVLNLQWQLEPATGTPSQPAQLRWAPADTRYQLSLVITADTRSRTASWLRSEGHLQPHGLAPVRHTARQGPASERALTFIRRDGQVDVAFSALTDTRSATLEVQDALSWLPQWLGQLAVGRAHDPIEVADVDGSLRPWQFIVDPDDPWHWETLPMPRQTTVALWLSPAAPHWPHRMVITPPWGAAWVLWREPPQTGAADE